MEKEEKIAYLQDKYFGDWVDARKQTELKLSEEQALFCCCGKLATGLHERNCRRFQSKVDSETVKRLSHLLKNIGVMADYEQDIQGDIEL